LLFPDYPIQLKEGDKLKRVPLAQNVADLILAFNGSESILRITFLSNMRNFWRIANMKMVNCLMYLVGLSISYISLLKLKKFLSAKD
jgi:hypothetical protein